MAHASALQPGSADPRRPSGLPTGRTPSPSEQLDILQGSGVPSGAYTGRTSPRPSLVGGLRPPVSVAEEQKPVSQARDFVALAGGEGSPHPAGAPVRRHGAWYACLVACGGLMELLEKAGVPFWQSSSVGAAVARFLWQILPPHSFYYSIRNFYQLSKLWTRIAQEKPFWQGSGSVDVLKRFLVQHLTLLTVYYTPKHVFWNLLAQTVLWRGVIQGAVVPVAQALGRGVQKVYEVATEGSWWVKSTEEGQALTHPQWQRFLAQYAGPQVLWYAPKHVLWNLLAKTVLWRGVIQGAVVPVAQALGRGVKKVYEVATEGSWWVKSTEAAPLTHPQWQRFLAQYAGPQALYYIPKHVLYHFLWNTVAVSAVHVSKRYVGFCQEHAFWKDSGEVAWQRFFAQHVGPATVWYTPKHILWNALAKPFGRWFHRAVWTPVNNFKNTTVAAYREWRNERRAIVQPH
jgi:hypothetical protein